MSTENTGDAKPLGIIGLVIGIFSLLFSIIPCIGYYALVPSVIALIFSIIGLVLLNQRNQETGIPISATVVASVAIIISIFQYVTFKDVFDAKDKINDSINAIEDGVIENIEEDIINGLKEGIENELENDSIRALDKDTMQFSENDTTSAI
jgi:hypothetical protein